MCSSTSGRREVTRVNLRMLMLCYEHPPAAIWPISFRGVNCNVFVYVFVVLSEVKQPVVLTAGMIQVLEELSWLQISFSMLS